MSFDTFWASPALYRKLKELFGARTVDTLVKEPAFEDALHRPTFDADGKVQQPTADELQEAVDRVQRDPNAVLVIGYTMKPVVFTREQLDTMLKAEPTADAFIRELQWRMEGDARERMRREVFQTFAETVEQHARTVRAATRKKRRLEKRARRMSRFPRPTR